MGYDSTKKVLSVNYPTTGTGISVNDVGTCLGLTSRDVGTLCTSSAVNVWAKYRPLQYGSPSGAGSYGQLTEQERKNLYYGWQPYQVNNRKQLIDAYQTTSDYSGWVLSTPQGYPNGWYRLLDFDGYYHLAEPPIKKFGGTSVAYEDSSSGKVSATCATPPVPSVLDGQSFSILDMADCLEISGNVHFGLALFKGTDLTTSSAGESAYAINANPIKQETGQINLSNVSATMNLNPSGQNRPFAAHTGEWTCFPFFFAPDDPTSFTTQWWSWRGDADLMQGRMYTVPMLRSFVCNILTTGGGGGGTGTLNKAFNVTRNYTNQTFEYELQLINQGAAITATVELYFMRSSSPSPAPPYTLAADEYKLTLDPITLASGASTIKTGSFNPFEQTKYNHLWDDGVVWLHFSAGSTNTYTKYFVPKVQPDDGGVVINNL